MTEYNDLSLISSKDKLFKFEKARKLNQNIKIIKQNYDELFIKEKQQLGVIIYLLEQYGFRGGSLEDKNTDKEEDGIGITTLPISSIKEITKDSIHLKFYGKSGIEFDEIINVEPKIQNLLKNLLNQEIKMEKYLI